MTGIALSFSSYLNDKIDATISFDMTLLQPPCGNTAVVLR